MKIGDEITLVTPQGTVIYANVIAIRPLIGTAPFEGFAWQINEPAGFNGSSYYRFDRQGIDWIPGHVIAGSEDHDAFLAARLLILSQGDRR